MRPNPGHLPDDCDGTDEGKTFRVHVVLRNGYDTRGREPIGWPAPGTRWTLTGHPFDIIEYEVIQ